MAPLPRLRRMSPDRGISNVSPFYFTVMGTCLSFVLVFESNIAYNRFWEARGHAGSICHCLRGLVRTLVFATNVAAGRVNHGQGAHFRGPTAQEARPRAQGRATLSACHQTTLPRSHRIARPMRPLTIQARHARGLRGAALLQRFLCAHAAGRAWPAGPGQYPQCAAHRGGEA